ncbi:MAG: hypothetical protein JSU68_10630 [Phycisphaerales bacterium]|nr:MAG: hypothetical protein JSU68_10630 [Phycisphaerales bacterium]
MKTRMMLLSVVGLSVVGLVAFVAWAGDEQEEEITLDAMPEAARAALLELAGGAMISEAECEQEHGVLVYEAEWVADGIEHEAAVTADGALLEMEEEIPLEAAPAAVRAAIMQHFGAGTMVTVDKKMVVVYEVEAKVDGEQKELLISPTGSVRKSAERGDKAHAHKGLGHKHGHEYEDDEDD